MTNILNSRVPWVVFATIQAMMLLRSVAQSQWPEAVSWAAGTLATIKVCTLLPR